VLKKKIWANFQRIIELFTQKIVNKLSKLWIWDPRSGIRKKPIPDPGVKKAQDPGSGSATLIVKLGKVLKKPLLLSITTKTTVGQKKGFQCSNQLRYPVLLKNR
jgi:hypothetical protein